MRGRKKSYAAKLQDGKHAIGKINRAVNMKIVIEDSKRCNILVKREAEDSQSEERS